MGTHSQPLLRNPGAGPGIFIRGGPTFPKKRGGGEKTKRRGLGLLRLWWFFPFAEVCVKLTFQTISYKFTFGRAWYFVQLQAPLYTTLHKHTADDIV